MVLQTPRPRLSLSFSISIALENVANLLCLLPILKMGKLILIIYASYEHFRHDTGWFLRPS